MKRSFAISLRLLLASFFACALSALAIETWIDARAQKLAQECKPLKLKHLPPELRAAIEQLRAEKPTMFNTDMSAIHQLLLHRAGLPMDVAGFLRLLGEPPRTTDARINYLTAMERRKYTTFGFNLFVSEEKDYLVVLLPQQENAPIRAEELQFFEVYDNVDGALRSADWYAFRETQP